MRLTLTFPQDECPPQPPVVDESSTGLLILETCRLAATRINDLLPTLALGTPLFTHEDAEFARPSAPPGSIDLTQAWQTKYGRPLPLGKTIGITAAFVNATTGATSQQVQIIVTIGP